MTEHFCEAISIGSGEQLVVIQVQGDKPLTPPDRQDGGQVVLLSVESADSNIAFYWDHKRIFEMDLKALTCAFADGVEPDEASRHAWAAFFAAVPGAVALLDKARES